MLREPLEVVRCLGSDLVVPAHCECVLEGTLDAGEQVEEGPVSEFHGLYENYGPGIVATFTRLTRRHDAVFQVILPGYHPEHCLLGGVAIAAGLARAARASVAAVREVAVGVGGAGRLHAVVSLRAPRPGDARKVAFAIWAAVNLIKQVIVVDDDVESVGRSAGRMGDRDPHESRIETFWSSPAFAPTARSRWNRAARSPSWPSMRRGARVTGPIGQKRSRPSERLSVPANCCAQI